MHYAVPRLLYRQNRLVKFYTDICAVKDWPRLFRLFPDGVLPTGIRRLKSRVPGEIPAQLILAFSKFGLEYQLRRSKSASAGELTAVHLWAGEKFCDLILKSAPVINAHLYCYNSAGLELLEHWNGSGYTSILEQTIAPRRIEQHILKDEELAYPGWQSPVVDDGFVDAYVEREEAEWKRASVIVCGSEFVKSGIGQCGGPVDRCRVVPYGLTLDAFSGAARKPFAGRPLRVLTVGEVCLRKGSHYVLQAARRLTGKVEFRMVGHMGFLPEREAEVRKAVAYAGVVERSDIARHFSWADVFLLPSLCEGSATVTYEALAAGLPVIATASSGSLLEHGHSGICIKERDVDAIVEALELLLDKSDLLPAMSCAALKKSRNGSIEAYGERLSKVLAV